MLVSCITPTAGRREFWPGCVRHFLAQDWPELEWVIIDNGEDTMHNLLPDDSRGLFLGRKLTYVRLPGPRLSHGALMNVAMAHATGEMAIVWDDDDWYAPDRVRKQAQPLVDRPEIDIVGTGRIYYYIYGTRRAFLYRNLTSRAWLAAPAFRRSVWEANKFDDVLQGPTPSSGTRCPGSAGWTWTTLACSWPPSIPGTPPRSGCPRLPSSRRRGRKWRKS